MMIIGRRIFGDLLATTGLGLGAILARAAEVTDSMVEASSLGLAQSLTKEEHALGMIYPRIERSKWRNIHHDRLELTLYFVTSP